MERYIMLFKFTDKGIANVQDSPNRAEGFKAIAAQVGAKVEFQYWTFGEFDGALVLTAPDDTAIGALAIGLGRLGNVRTTMLRAFDINEFRTMLEKMPKF